MEPTELERFEAIVLPHLDSAWGLARFLMRDDADAEDVVQEACLRALRYIHGFRGEGAREGRAWLLTIVRNMAHTWRGRRQAEGSTVALDEGLHGTEPEAADAADHELGRREARETVGQALARLPADLREVIVLRELEGLSYKEIADVAGVPIGTVMSRLSRARKRLQGALASSGKDG